MESETRKPFIRYSFFRVEPEWRRLAEGERREGRAQLVEAIEEMGSAVDVRSYSLIGTRADVDFMLWQISPSLEALQDLASGIMRAGMGKYLTMGYSYLATTRPSPYTKGHHHTGAEFEGRIYQAKGGRVSLRISFYEDSRVVPASPGIASVHHGRALQGGTPISGHQGSHCLLVRHRRPRLRSGVRGERPGGVRPAGDGTEALEGEALYLEGHANFHVREDAFGRMPGEPGIIGGA